MSGYQFTIWFPSDWEEEGEKERKKQKPVFKKKSNNLKGGKNK